MKYNFDYYIKTLQPKVNDINTLVDVNKIFSNMKDIESDLNSLNYLICNNKEEFIKRVKFLFNKNRACFKTVFILIAVRFEENIKFKINDIIMDTNGILNDDQRIIDLFFNSKIIDFILQGKIKNFVDYAYGIEVGMDTNARKNRNGSKIEEKLFNQLVHKFKEYDYIEIKEQEKIKIINSKKVFDVVIHNKRNKKSILIESSYYNTGGSKINETNRGYFELYNKINDNLSNYKFIWLADGQGMSTIRNQLEPNFDKGYILNHKMFWDLIKEIVD